MTTTWRAGKLLGDWFWYRLDRNFESWWHEPDILGGWPHTKWNFIRLQLEAAARIA